MNQFIYINKLMAILQKEQSPDMFTETWQHISVPVRSVDSEASHMLRDINILKGSIIGTIIRVRRVGATLQLFSYQRFNQSGNNISKLLPVLQISR